MDHPDPSCTDVVLKGHLYIEIIKKPSMISTTVVSVKIRIIILWFSSVYCAVEVCGEKTMVIAR